MWNSTNMPVATRTLIAAPMGSLYLLLHEGCKRFEPYMMRNRGTINLFTMCGWLLSRLGSDLGEAGFELHNH